MEAEESLKKSSIVCNRMYQQPQWQSAPPPPPPPPPPPLSGLEFSEESDDDMMDECLFGDSDAPVVMDVGFDTVKVRDGELVLCLIILLYSS